MRALLSLLLSLVLACGLAVAVYAAMWALRREPLAVAAPAPAAARPPLPTIGRLPDSPDFARSMASAPDRGDAALAPLTVLVRNVPTAWPNAAAGLAIAPTRGGDGMAWVPLADATRSGDGWQVRHQVPVGEEYEVALAAERPGALRSYVARATLRVDGAAALTVDGRAALVTFRLPDGADRHGPFRIVRDGAEGWSPAQAPTGLTLAPGEPQQAWLGAGTYRLVDVMFPDRDQTFVVPEATDVVVSATLAAVRAGRQ